jgi:hypothetical protein
MPAPGELTLIAPRRAKPPRHLADLTLAERRAAVVELGQPAFRANQLSNHYFTRLDADAADFTDVPLAMRQPLVDALLPALATQVREISCDGGMTRKTVWRLFDGTLVESVLMRYIGAAGHAADGGELSELGDEAELEPTRSSRLPEAGIAPRSACRARRAAA